MTKVDPGPEAPTAGPIHLDPTAAGQLAAALHQHQHALARAGLPEHPEVARLLRFAVLTARSLTARSRQGGRPAVIRVHACLVIDDEPTVSIPAAAELVGLSERSINRRIADGTLPVVRLGRRVLVRRVDLDALTA